MVCLARSISVQNTGHLRFSEDTSGGRRAAHRLFPGIGLRRYLSSSKRTGSPEGSPLPIFGKYAVLRFRGRILSRSFWRPPPPAIWCIRGRIHMAPCAKAALPGRMRGYVGDLPIFWHFWKPNHLRGKYDGKK